MCDAEEDALENEETGEGVDGEGGDDEADDGEY